MLLVREIMLYELPYFKFVKVLKVINFFFKFDLRVFVCYFKLAINLALKQ